MAITTKIHSSNSVLNWVYLIIGIFPWIIYAFNINIRLDSLIDEGLTLLMVNPVGTPKYMSSQFGNIVSPIFRAFNYNAIASLWARFLLELLSISILCFCSLLYIKRKTSNIFNSFYYIGLFMSVSSYCLYSFTKSLSYNHLQQFVVSTTVSLLLLHEVYFERKVLKNILLIGIGFFLFLGILNVLPSGIVVTFIVYLTLIIKNSQLESIINTTFYFLGGIVIGLLFFSSFFYSVNNLYFEYYEMFSLILNKTSHHHNSFILLFNFFKSLFSLFVISVCSIGILSIFDLISSSLKKRSYFNFLPILCFLIVVLYFQKYTKTGGFQEWIVTPLAMTLFVFFKNNSLTQYLYKNRQEAIIIALLISIPLVAPLGTNLLITSKVGYYFSTWLVAVFLLSVRIDRKYFQFFFSIFFLLSLSWNIPFIYNYINTQKEYNTKSHKLPALNNIYITLNQKKHFEQLYNTLKVHGYTSGDRILAFQPDLMSLFSVGAVSGNRIYFLPLDFLNENFSLIPRFQFIILNDYSYSQVKNALKPWGFPEQYEKIMIGTPETVDYFGADKPRMLFCLKKQPSEK